MDRIERVAIIGLGAIGASYMARIQEKIPVGNIRAVASGDRGRRYRSNGVYVNGRQYFFQVCDPSDDFGPADLVLFAVKHNNLKEAIADAKNQIGGGTIIMSLLNGITSEREIAAAYGAKHTLLSTVIKIAATRTGDQTVNTQQGIIQFGAADSGGEQQEDVRLVREFFDLCGVTYEIYDDMKRILWKKFMLNVGINQTTAVLRLPYGPMREIESARAIAMAAMREVIPLAAFEGVALTDDDVSDAMSRIDTLSYDGKTSMLQDVEASRPTETAILGESVAELGRLHGVPVPVNEMLSGMIRAIEESYAKRP